MSTVATQLIQIVDSAELILRRVSEPESSEPALEGGWSRKQLLGHLIDSASNNHQRFVRAALAGALDFPEYDQTGCVRVQAAGDAPWPVLVDLWVSYNRYLAHVIAHLPAAKLQAPCRIGPKEPVTLAFLTEDYLRHMLHHLSQIGVAATAGTPGYA